MAKMDWPVPIVFCPEGEDNKLLAQARSRLVKNFKWSRAQCLYDAGDLAVLLHVFGRDDEALEVCRALGRIQFDGKFSLWSAVEMALALQSRWLRKRGQPEEAAECMRRVREAGFSLDRLNGTLLDRNGTLEGAIEEGNAKREREARLTRAKELAFIIELGGSEMCPVEKMEQEWERNMVRLRDLAGA